MMRRSQVSWGFTLVEILAALVIIGILLSVAIPSLLGFRARLAVDNGQTKIFQAFRVARTNARESARGTFWAAFVVIQNGGGDYPVDSGEDGNYVIKVREIPPDPDSGRGVEIDGTDPAAARNFDLVFPDTVIGPTNIIDVTTTFNFQIDPITFEPGPGIEAAVFDSRGFVDRPDGGPNQGRYTLTSPVLGTTVRRCVLINTFFGNFEARQDDNC